MNKRVRNLVMAMLFVLGMVLMAPNAHAAAPKLNKKSITLVSGTTYDLKVTGGKAKKWKSKNTKIAKVSKAGKVTAKKAGKTTITVKVGKKTLKCKVTVIKGKVPFYAEDAEDVRPGDVFWFQYLVPAKKFDPEWNGKFKGNSYLKKITSDNPNITIKKDSKVKGLFKVSFTKPGTYNLKFYVKDSVITQKYTAIEYKFLDENDEDTDDDDGTYDLVDVDGEDDSDVELLEAE